MSDALIWNFRDESSALRFVEQLCWPHGVVCPRCNTSDRIGALHGQSTQLGSYKCYRCRKIFTVKTGTFFESSNIPLHKWLQAIYLCAADEVRPSYLAEVLRVTFKTAAFMLDRIHYASAKKVLSEWGHASLVPACSSADIEQDGPAPLDEEPRDSSCDLVIHQNRQSDAQFRRFLLAANRKPADKSFEETFKRIIRSRIKLRELRERERGLTSLLGN